MIRVLATADLHLEDGRLDRQRPVLEQIVKDAQVLRPDLVLVPGDLFGHRVPHRSSPSERMVMARWVQDLARLAPVVIVYGNHDAPEDLDVFSLLESSWPIYLVEAAQRLEVRTPSGLVHVCALGFPRRRALLEGEDLPKGPEHVRLVMNEKIAGLIDAWRLLEASAKAGGIPLIFTAHAQTRGCHTSGGEVLGENEIEIGRDLIDQLDPDLGVLGHIHLRQMVAARTYYPGSPWPVDHGEQEAKSYLVADLMQDAEGPEGENSPLEVLGVDRVLDWEDHDRNGRGRLRVWAVGTGAVPLRTLAWRWGIADGEDAPRWLSEPRHGPGVALGAVVRARLFTTAAVVGSCPWAEAVAPYKAVASAWKEERVIEPAVSVRNPEVAAATTPEDKLLAYWATLGAGAPSEAAQNQALAALDKIETDGLEATKQGITEILEGL